MVKAYPILHTVLSVQCSTIIHGIRVYEAEYCKEQAEKLLFTLHTVKQKLEDTYGYSGWERLIVRKKSKLHLDPKVKIIKNL